MSGAQGCRNGAELGGPGGGDCVVIQLLEHERDLVEVDLRIVDETVVVAEGQLGTDGREARGRLIRAG